MKKMFIIALAATMATSAFAQNPDALKQIKKAKSVQEAASLVTANEKSMTAAENAQAYNKLVDLVMGPVNKANEIIQTNMAMEQMGQAGKEVNKDEFYKNLLVAYDYALKCDKYDVQPNDKGKVAPKFRKSNADRLYNLRVQLISAGQAAQEADKNAEAAEFYGCYAVTGAAPMFADNVAAAAKIAPDGKADPYLSEVARVASITYFQAGKLAQAQECSEIVMQDPEKESEGLSLKMYILQQSAKTHADSLACLKELETLYQKYPKSNDVFAQLAQWYVNLGQNDKQAACIADRLQKDPNNFTALAMQGQNLMNAKKNDEAIESFKKAVECDIEDVKQKALIYTYIGFCYNAKAVEEEKYENQLEQVKAGIPFLEKAREIDPERERSNWAYPLYQSYYNVYGEDDARTKELQSLQ